MKQKNRKLFCLPSAGGLSTYFHGLRENLSPFMDVIIIDYSGHGTRMGENLDSSFEEIIHDVAERILNQIDAAEEIFILGYSMGSLIAYIIASDPSYKINPSYLFLCAFQSPNLLKEKRFLIYSAEEESAFIRKYGNIDECILKSTRFEEVFTAPLKNDFACLSKYELLRPRQVSCEITVMYGEQDFNLEDVEGWKSFTVKNAEIIALPGRHFFLNENLDEICREIKRVNNIYRMVQQ